MMAEAPTPDDQRRKISPDGRSPTPIRRWVFRLLSVLLPLAILTGLELTFRLVGWGATDPLIDPFLLSAQTPVFELSPDRSRYQTRPEKLRIFPHQEFPARKAPNEFRIFCIGGSTVQGRPYSSPTAFPTWLEIYLASAFPDRQWTTVNVGGISYGTQRLVPVLQECLGYQPDLVVLCTGHNEFLERHTYDHLPPAALGISRLVRGLHIYRAIERLVTPAVTPPTSTGSIPTEVDTILDHRGGLESFRYDPGWRRHVLATFEKNIHRLIRMSSNAGIPLIAIKPPSNLKDCPPFKSTFTRPLSEQLRSEWQALIESSNHVTSTGFQEPISLLERMLAIDDEHALTHYLLGQLHFADRSPHAARRYLTLARDNDICPLRILGPMEKSLDRVSTGTSTPLLDAQALIAGHSPFGIPGNQLLVDHVHPSVKGHQQIAERLAPLVSRALGLPTRSVDKSDLHERYQAHTRSLSPLYFTHGLRRLRAVQAWTEGRVDEPHPPRETLPAETE